MKKILGATVGAWLALTCAAVADPMVPSGSNYASPTFTGTVTFPDGSSDNATTNFILSPAGTTSNPALTFGACGSTCGLIFPAANQIEFFNGSNLLDYNFSSVGSWNFKTAINMGNHFISGLSAVVFNGSITLTGTGASGLQLGSTDAASPVAATVKGQSVIAGTTNGAGVNTTFIGSLSTGSGTSGDLIFQTGGTGAGSTAQNSPATALIIKGATQLVTLPAITTDATHTDASLCEDTTTHAIYFGSGAAGICLGTSSARFKHGVRPLDAGLEQIAALEPVAYHVNADHGDPNKLLYGFTAEQGAKVLPDLTGEDAEGRPNTFDYVGVVPVLVNAVKQLKAENDNLRACNADWKCRLLGWK